MHDITVETAHSLAFRHVVIRSNYTVRKTDYKSYEIAEHLGIQGSDEKHTEYIIANHVSKFVAYFCNSDKRRVQELNYLDVVSEPKAQTFVSTFYDYILLQTRRFLDLMNKGAVEITHDFYLKKFQLSDPVLHYDYILFDEGQDASPAMLDVFLKQQAVKVIVGDTHQQIYSWRHAVNSLQHVDFPVLNLSASFRFPQSIATLATGILDWKKHLGEPNSIQITGKGVPGKGKQKAVIARTNLGLLLKAIAYVTERKSLQKIYFEGNIYSYTYADEGASLYDVLHLYNNKRSLIRDKLIQQMATLADLEDYIEKTEDAQLGMMLEIVEEYGNEIPAIIKSLKDKHTSDEEKEKAELVFSTVHRCKGMEYDEVQIVEDFLSEEKIEKALAEKKSISKINEEINLLYVAVTRTKRLVNIPESLVPLDIPVSPNIRVLTPEKYPSKTKGSPVEEDYTTSPAGKLKKEKTKAKKSDQPTKKPVLKTDLETWRKDEDKLLEQMYYEGSSSFRMSKVLNRPTSEILRRIKELQLK